MDQQMVRFLETLKTIGDIVDQAAGPIKENEEYVRELTKLFGSFSKEEKHTAYEWLKEFGEGMEDWSLNEECSRSCVRCK